MNIKDYITTVPNFPKEGILFRDITPLIQNGKAFNEVTNILAKRAKELGATLIAGPEARGFIFGTPVANKLDLGFIAIRKPGKLPRQQVCIDYDLEYGTNTLCIHYDAINPGDKVFIIDDLLATGGTALAACKLIEKAGGVVVGLGFVIDLKDLGGRELLKDYNVLSLTEYEGA